MYVAVVPNRGSPPAILLRESYREAGKTKNRTLANLSRWPAERSEQPFIEAQLVRRHLKNGALLLYDVTSTPAFARAGSTSKDAAANWPSMATAATTGATGRRLSLA